MKSTLIRLRLLKPAARINIKGLKNHIASTRRRVVKSAKSVRRFARELASHAAAPSQAVHGSVRMGLTAGS